MLVDLALFALALALGLAAAVLGRAKPPALDAARLWRTCQSALLWGQEEQGEGSVSAWTERVGKQILYHPAQRSAWCKLEQPQDIELPVPSLPGERALVEDLQGLEPGPGRTARLFADDMVRGVLLDDPRLLGEAYDPARWLGHGCDWEGLASWAEPLRKALARRLEHHTVVLVAPEEAQDAAHALGAALEPETTAAQLPLEPAWVEPEGGEGLAQALLAMAPRAADRLLLVAMGRAGAPLLQALESDPFLRDRVMLVLLDGCPLGGVEVDQESLDTELRRSTPYCLLGRIDPEAWPPGDGSTPWSQQRFDEPPVPPSGRRPVAVLDLGAAPADRASVDPTAYGRSLLLLFAFLLGQGVGDS